MISDIFRSSSEEARSPALPPPMPSETAKTRSCCSSEWEPDSGKVSAPAGLEEKASHESSLRGLREPLWVRAAQ